MDDHFSTVAANYNDLRTTDIAPIRYIQTLLAGHHPLNAADIGCGSGRYSLLLLQQFPDLKLTCGDVNREMLNEAERYLKRNGQTGFSVKQTDASRLPFQAGSLDCVLTFNAFHHFDPEGFLNSARDALREGGMLFIYTRLKSQNAQSVWGRYFPGFREKEARLTDREHIERWSHCMPGLSMVKVRAFGYQRDESLETLLHQARNHHYSTFSLYSQTELTDALNKFESRIRRNFSDLAHVKWVDENVMLVFQRAGDSVER